MEVVQRIPSRVDQEDREYGEWKIMVDQSKCTYVHRNLTSMWQKLTPIPAQGFRQKRPGTIKTPIKMKILTDLFSQRIITGQSVEYHYQQRTPREAFIHDLQSFIRRVQNKGEEIILVGDFNEEMSTPTSGKDRLATNCGLADLFSILLGTPCGPAMYQRGPRRIDYALVSPALVEHVPGGGI
ncbi:hypothetical protein G9A89_000554 [Geosiphon pyriformis]|nr:hypothetical protein G9A89_000554 [Geosiphon pyriformis]